MAVSTDNAFSGPYIANGVTTVFPFDFTATAPSDVATLLRDIVGNQVPAGAYSVQVNAGAGGAVTFAMPPAPGISVIVLLDPSFTQELKFENGSAWRAEPVNEGYDRSALRDQVLLREIGRGIKTPLGEDGAELPPKAMRLPGSPLGVDPVTKEVALLDPGVFVGAPGSSLPDVGPVVGITGLGLAPGVTGFRASYYDGIDALSPQGPVGGATYGKDPDQVSAKAYSWRQRAANGIWYRMDQQVVRPEMFGAGLNRTAAQNKAALRTMRAYLRQRSGRKTVYFPADLYNAAVVQQFTGDGRWTWGCGELEVQLGASALQNIDTSTGVSTDRIPWQVNQDPMTDFIGADPDADYSAANYVNFVGHLINSTKSSDLQITVSNPALMSADIYFPGARCLLHDWNMGIAGGPPCMRQFKYLVMKTVNLVTGVVTFSAPLGFEFRSDRLDVDNGSNGLLGKARILPLDRGRRFSLVDLVVRGGLMKESLGGNGVPAYYTSLGGSIYTTGCWRVEMFDVGVGGYFYPTASRRVETNGCFFYNVEADKLVELWSDLGSEFGTYGNGPGILKIHLCGTTILRPMQALTAREQVFEHCKVLTGNGKRLPSFVESAEPSISQMMQTSFSPGVAKVCWISPTIDTRDARSVASALPDQAGATSTQVILSPAASAVDGDLVGCEVEIFGGTGARQVRTISAYVGATRTATLSSAWTTQPATGSNYRIDRVLPFVSAASPSKVTVTVAGVNASGFIQAAITNGGLNDEILKGIQPGSLLVFGAKTYKVHDLIYDGTYHVIRGSWISAAPVVGDVYTANRTLCFEMIGQPVVIGNQPNYRNTSSTPNSLVNASATSTLADNVRIDGPGRAGNFIDIPFLFFRDLTRGSGTLNIPLYGKSVVSVEVIVTAAYAGGAATANLTVSRLSAEGAQPFSMLVNMKTAGGRRIDTVGGAGSVAGDTGIAALTVVPFNVLTLTTNTDLSDAPPAGYVRIGVIN